MKTLKITARDYLKANRKASREAEIGDHGRPVGFHRVHKSKKAYDRKKQRADDKRHLPSSFPHISPFWGLSARRSASNGSPFTEKIPAGSPLRL